MEEIRGSVAALVREMTPEQKFKAILFDVDGTLYGQRPVRLRMLVKLMGHVAAHPRTGPRTLRVLRAYRRAQEHLRSCQGAASEQLSLCCDWTREDRSFVAGCVEQWMEREPLRVLPRFGHAGLRDLLIRARERGIRLGVVSDYPAAAKLKSMELAEFFDVVVSAGQPGIPRFKPCPNGILHALRQLEVVPHDALYVGDRPEVDAEAARNAHVAAVILGRGDSARVQFTQNYASLSRRLFGEL
jgi:FMN phosphatase YigB (HAD superfamily)